MSDTQSIETTVRFTVNAIDDRQAAKIANQLNVFLEQENIHQYISINNFSKALDDTELRELNNKTKFQNIYVVDLDLGNGIERGLKFIKRIRDKNDASKIFVLSGNLKSNDNRLACFEAGAYEVFSKENIMDKLRIIAERIKDDFIIEVKKNEKTLSERLEGQVIRESTFLTQVIEFSEDQVKLAVKKSNGKKEKRLWFDIERVDSPDDICLDNCYKMTDEILRMGESRLVFSKISNEDLNDKSKENSEYEQLKNSKLF